jgi:hypothetical protein
MKRKQPKKKYVMYGCTHRFIPSPETEKECKDCPLTPESQECKDDFLAGERCPMFIVYSY